MIGHAFTETAREAQPVDTHAAGQQTPAMQQPDTTLTTIGYEGALLDDFVATLKASSVSLLVDVRELPISRRKGFAKSALSTAVAEAGIRYLHLRGLGDPKEGRDAARSGNHARFLQVFKAHLLTTGAQLDLSAAASLAVKGGVCLMCYERDHAVCHRTLVAEAIRASVQVRIRHIGVRSGLAAAEHSATGAPAAVWA